MVKRSENIVDRLFNRQISCTPSNSQLHKVRKLYENIVPSHTVYDVECPDHVFRKFTNDGQYLIAFSRNYQQLVVYRFNWMSYCLKGESSESLHDDFHLLPKSSKFESFFTQLYCISLASGNETICKDFFLATENGVYGLFATSTRLDADSSTTDGAVPGVPSLERIKILVVRLADGVVTDDRIYHDDFIHLSHNMGVFMYEDLLAVLSIRHQCVHILQIRATSGTFVDVRKVGDFCQEDDELLLKSQTQQEALFQSRQGLLRRSKDSPAAEFPSSRTKLDNTPRHILEQHSAETNSTPVRGGVDEALTDVHFEGYFRGLLSDTTSDHRLAGSSSSLRIPSANSHNIARTTFSPLSLETGHYFHQQQSSVNNANASANHNERRAEYVITSRQGGIEESSAGTSSGMFVLSGMHTPVSSTGSRSIFSSSTTGGVDITTANATTSSSRVDFAAQTNNLTRAVPFVSRFANSSSSSLTRSVHEEQEQNAAADGASQAPALGGIKQRLLSFIFRTAFEQDKDPLVRAQRLKRFYYHFQHYLELVMWKVQFLDRYHLLIKFGSADGVLSRDASQQPAFFVVYNFETTEILEFQQNSSEDFLQLFENFADHFRVSQHYPLFMNYVTSSSNNVFVREQIREQKAACISSKATNKANSYVQIARRTLSQLPINSQSQSPSPYFDHSLFHFDEKLISATDRHKPSMEHPIKFLSRRRPHSLKFKINPGPENGANDSRIKRVAAFIFHPIFPFAVSIQQSFMQASVINFHFRR